MDKIHLDIPMLGSVAAWNQLKSACQVLGSMAESALVANQSLYGKLKEKRFDLARRQGYSQFKSDNFYGVVLSPTPEQGQWGIKLNEAYVAIWSGVLLGEVFDIDTVITNTPEFVTGITIWFPRSDNNKEYNSSKSTLTTIQKHLHKNSYKEWEISEKTLNNGGQLTLRFSKPLIHIYNPNCDWLDTAKNFFQESFNQLSVITGQHIISLQK